MKVPRDFKHCFPSKHNLSSCHPTRWSPFAAVVNVDSYNHGLYSGFEKIRRSRLIVRRKGDFSAGRFAVKQAKKICL